MSVFLLIRLNTVPCCQKHTPTGCFFGDFAHWVVIQKYCLTADFHSLRKLAGRLRKKN